MQIKKLDKKYDATKLLDIYESLNSDANQICFTSRGNDDFSDGTGSIFQYTPSTEWDWSHINPLFHGTYLEEVYEDLKQDWKIGRARFMKMDSSNRALSYHYDEGFRLHIPLITCPEARFILEDWTTYYMDEVGGLYVLDANKYHSALNLSRKNDIRIHIVFSAEKKLSET